MLNIIRGIVITDKDGRRYDRTWSKAAIFVIMSYIQPYSTEDNDLGF